MNFLYKNPARFTLALVFALTSGISFAQKFDRGPNNNPLSTTSRESSNYKGLNCPVTHVSGRCLPRQNLPRANSREDCGCRVKKVKNGKTTLWVRDCYVQLPDNTVFFCKPPIHKMPRG